MVTNMLYMGTNDRCSWWELSCKVIQFSWRVIWLCQMKQSAHCYYWKLEISSSYYPFNFDIVSFYLARAVSIGKYDPQLIWFSSMAMSGLMFSWNSVLNFWYGNSWGLSVKRQLPCFALSWIAWSWSCLAPWYNYIFSWCSVGLCHNLPHRLFSGPDSKVTHFRIRA